MKYKTSYKFTASVYCLPFTNFQFLYSQFMWTKKEKNGFNGLNPLLKVNKNSPNILMD